MSYLDWSCPIITDRFPNRLRDLVSDHVSHSTALFTTVSISQAYRHFHGKSSDQLLFIMSPARTFTALPHPQVRINLISYVLLQLEGCSTPEVYFKESLIRGTDIPREYLPGHEKLNLFFKGQPSSYILYTPIGPSRHTFKTTAFVNSLSSVVLWHYIN